LVFFFCGGERRKSGCGWDMGISIGPGRVEGFVFVCLAALGVLIATWVLLLEVDEDGNRIKDILQFCNFSFQYC
jgi:hypothetical protein